MEHKFKVGDKVRIKYIRGSIEQKLKYNGSVAEIIRIAPPPYLNITNLSFKYHLDILYSARFCDDELSLVDSNIKCRKNKI